MAGSFYLRTEGDWMTQYVAVAENRADFERAKDLGLIPAIAHYVYAGHLKWRLPLAGKVVAIGDAAPGLVCDRVALTDREPWR